MSVSSGISYKSEESDTKRQKLLNRNYLSFVSINIELSFYNKYNRISIRYNIFPTKLVTALKSIINQIDWSEIVLDIVKQKRSILYWNAFEKILRLYIEKLLTQKNRKKNKLNCYQKKDQKLSSAIKNTEQILFEFAFTSCSTKKFFSLKKQKNIDSFVNNISKISEHNNFTDKSKKSKTDKNNTEYKSNSKNKNRDYKKDRVSI